MRMDFPPRPSRKSLVRPPRGNAASASARPFRQLLLLLAYCATAVLVPGSTAQAEGLDLQPTSSREARQEAAGAIPFQKLSAEDRRQVAAIVENASLYRRLPTKVVTCEPSLFSLFMEHPEAMVNVWEVLGISKVRMTPAGENAFHAADGHGTQGTLRLLECVCDDNAQNRVVVLASGTYQGGAISGPVRADCVALVRSGSVRQRDGRAFVTARIDVFIHLDQLGVELVARTFQPLLVRVADRNFEQTMEFVSSFSEAAEKNPRGIERLAARLDRVPHQVQERLTHIAYELSNHRTPSAGPPQSNDRTRTVTSVAPSSSKE